MAQYKYDLYTVPTDPRGPPKHHPWYKERLQLKFLKSSKQSAVLNGARWVSLAGDMDDFRSGAPRQTKGSEMVKKAQVNPVPLVDSRSSEAVVTRKRGRRYQSGIPSHNPGIHTLYKKVGPRRQLQQAHMRELEAGLLEHPLRLYPHLKEAVAPKLLEDVVGILDPDLKPTDSNSDLSGSVQSVCQPDSDHAPHKEDTRAEMSTSDDDGTETSPPCAQAMVYQWPLKQSEEEKKKEQSLLASQQVVSPTQESRVNQVTHDLVQWVRDLGGSDDIDEATVQGLFASNYETRPILAASIRVVELENVPTELRLESRGYSAGSFSLRPSTGEGEEWRGERRRRRRRRAATFPEMEVEEGHCVRTRYGAWYLPVSLWRPRHWDEPLRDPREEAMAAENEVARKNQAMDEMLAELHGTQAFREFVISHRPGANIPKFLKSVSVDKTQKLPQTTRHMQTVATP